MATYCIIRCYENMGGLIEQCKVRTDLTLEQAQAHCNSEEASSLTCARPFKVDGVVVRYWDTCRHESDFFKYH